MKKLLLISLIIVALFVALFFLTKSSDSDNLYNNSISFDQLKKSLANNENLLVYFYQTDCMYCKKTTPIVVPMAEKMGIDLKVFNLQEDISGWEQFDIKGTPTIVNYKNGKEFSRIHGQQSEEEFQKWFSENYYSSK